eukprot:7824838-Alexandrium_andersonii.AAC.1
MGTRPSRGDRVPITLQSSGRLSMRASGCCAPCCPAILSPCIPTPSSRPTAPKDGPKLRHAPSSNTVCDVLSWPFRHAVRLKAG